MRENHEGHEINKTLKVSKLAKINGRNESGVSINKLISKYQVSSLTGMIWIPEHMLVPVRAQA